MLEIINIGLREREQRKYELIEKLVTNGGNKRRASIEIGCSLRTVDRLIQRFIDGGKDAFIHGNRNRPPVHAFSDSHKDFIVNLYITKYHDATFAYAAELLAQNDNIIISPAALARILYAKNITSPRTKKITKRAIKARIKAQADATHSAKKKAALTASLLAITDAHPRRPRSPYFGEMLQMDASVHHWFGTEKAFLHIAIDDSTGTIVAAHFDAQETLNGYYNVLHQVLSNYGIPAMFYTDNRTVFEYRRKGNLDHEHDTFTQFGYACHQLGIELKSTSVPQAKGRVERAFQTLQQRLPIALRLAGIKELDDANAFLNSHIKEHNAKFALPIDDTKSVFEMQPSKEKVNCILAVITERKVDAGHCIKFENRFFKIIAANGTEQHFRKGTAVTVIQTFNKRLVCCIDDVVYDMDLVPSHLTHSKNFDSHYQKPIPVKRNIPALDHPWRKGNFLAFKNRSRFSSFPSA